MPQRKVTHQLTVRLPADLSRALKTAARQMQRKRAEVIRLALRQYLGLSAPGRGRPAERVRGLIGSLESGSADLAEKHREFILETLKNVR